MMDERVYVCIKLEETVLSGNPREKSFSARMFFQWKLKIFNSHEDPEKVEMYEK